MRSLEPEAILSSQTPSRGNSTPETTVDGKRKTKTLSVVGKNW